MVSSRLVAIHQPNFLPWLGYFDKIVRADVFVILDNVQFSRGTLVNRVRVIVANKPHWATASCRPRPLRSKDDPRDAGQRRAPVARKLLPGWMRAMAARRTRRR